MLKNVDWVGMAILAGVCGCVWQDIDDSHHKNRMEEIRELRGAALAEAINNESKQ